MTENEREWQRKSEESIELNRLRKTKVDKKEEEKNIQKREPKRIGECYNIFAIAFLSFRYIMIMIIAHVVVVIGVNCDCDGDAFFFFFFFYFFSSIAEWVYWHFGSFILCVRLYHMYVVVCVFNTNKTNEQTKKKKKMVCRIKTRSIVYWTECIRLSVLNCFKAIESRE